MTATELPITNYALDSYRRDYQRQGFALIPNLITRATEWSKVLLERSDSYDVLLLEEHRTIDAGGGHNSHLAFDRFRLDEIIPEIGELYSSLISFTQKIVSPYVVASPYRRSAYYAKIYKAPTHQQGWHYDTNTATGVLYLTTNRDGGTTEITTLNGNIVEAAPVANSLLLLNGRRCWHRANPVAGGSSKVTILMNFYTLGHQLRAPHLDRLIFVGSRSGEGY